MFPTEEALAAAEEAQVLKAWEGLGYYSRARALHAAAQRVAIERNGVFPSDFAALLKLPGVGPYTAGAVASIAFGERVPAVDGNVYRVMARVFGVRESVDYPKVQQRIRELVMAQQSSLRPGDFNQALMELGATLCLPLRPQCDACPWQDACDACEEGDAELLPVHEKKKPQKVVPVAVCLLTWQGKVLVTKRTQRLLNGLYVFVLLEEETDPARVGDLLGEQGLSCGAGQTLGTARHVFTHRIWAMTVFHYPLAKQPPAAVLEMLGGKLADGEALAALAMPAAMKAARTIAEALLDGERD